MGKVAIECAFCGKKFYYEKSYIKSLKSSRYCCEECYKTRRKIVLTDGTHDYIDAPYKKRDWLYEEYINKNRDCLSIARECGINVRTLKEWIRIHNLVAIKPVWVRSRLPANEIIRLYIDNKMSSVEIAKIYNTTGNTIMSLLRDNNIKVRTAAENSKINLYEKGGLDKMRKAMSTDEFRVRWSCKQRGIPIEEFDGFSTGEDHIIRNSWQYKEWRLNVFKRDGYRCQCCGEKTRKLRAHHIVNFKVIKNTNKDLWDINNGITLCDKCHDIKYSNSFHRLYGEQNNNKEQLEEYIKMRKSL